MPSNIHGFKIGSSEYQYDYDYLANKPEAMPVYDTTGSDDGKVLTINSSHELEWGEVFPDYSSKEQGTILTVVDPSVSPSEGGIDWLSPEELNILPEYDPYDTNKVLGLVDGDQGEAHISWVDYIPAYDTTDQDISKVLTINDHNELSWEYAVPELPNDSDYARAALITNGSGSMFWDSVFPVWYADENGKVLTIVSSSAGPAGNPEGIGWVQILPPYDSSDAGKVLSVDEYGELEWITP